MDMDMEQIGVRVIRYVSRYRSALLVTPTVGTPYSNPSQVRVFIAPHELFPYHDLA